MVVVVQRGLDRGDGELFQLVAAADDHRDGLPAAGADNLGQLLFGGNFFPVQREDDIAFQDAGILCRIHRLALQVGYRSSPHDHDAVGHHLDAKRDAAQRHHPAVHHLDADVLDVDEPQQAQLHLKGVPGRGVDRKRVGAAAARSLNQPVVADGKIISLCQIVSVGQLGGEIECKAKSAHHHEGKYRGQCAVGMKEKFFGKDMGLFHRWIPRSSKSFLIWNRRCCFGQDLVVLFNVYSGGKKYSREI